MIPRPAHHQVTARWLPLPVGRGAGRGADVALGAALGAALMLANLAAFAWVGPRFVASLAAGEGGGLWGPLLFAKWGLMVGLVVELAQRLPAEGVALGLSPLFFGTVGALVFARPVPALATPREV